MNYRIDLPSSISKDHIAHQRWDKLCKQDQLIKQKKLNKVGKGWEGGWEGGREGGRDGGREGESRIRRRRGIGGKKGGRGGRGGERGEEKGGREKEGVAGVEERKKRGGSIVLK